MKTATAHPTDDKPRALDPASLDPVERSLFSLLLWMVVDNTGLDIAEDPAGNGQSQLTQPTGAARTSLLQKLAFMAQDQPPAEVAQQLYGNLITQLETQFTDRQHAILVQLTDSAAGQPATARALINYGQAASVLRALADQINRGNFADNQASAYTVGDHGCAVESILAVAPD